jgi:hypothetical protein
MSGATRLPSPSGERELESLEQLVEGVAPER